MNPMVNFTSFATEGRVTGREGLRGRGGDLLSQLQLVTPYNSQAFEEFSKRKR
jgi:hypothetical protein